MFNVLIIGKNLNECIEIINVIGKFELNFRIYKVISSPKEAIEVILFPLFVDKSIIAELFSL